MLKKMERSNIGNNIIRKAVQSDIEQLARLQLLVWQDEYRKLTLDKPLYNFFLSELCNRWQKKLLKDDVQVILLEQENKVMGFIAFTLSNKKNSSSPQIEIENFMLLPEIRKQGIGRYLCDLIFTEFVKPGLTVNVWLLQEDQQTQLIYTKLGFKKTTKKRNHKIFKNVTLEEVQFQKIMK